MNKNRNTQKGMVSQILLFVALIFMANVALFAPNIQSLREIQKNKTDDTQNSSMQILMNNIAKDSYYNVGDREISIRPPAAVKGPNDGSTTYEPFQLSDSNFIDVINGSSNYGRFINNYSDRPRYLPVKYHAITNDAKNFRYCPYVFGPAVNSPTTHLLGYFTNSPPRFAMDGKMPENYYDNEILFTVVLDSNITTCTQSTYPENRRDRTKVFAFTVGMARSVLRSKEIESATLNPSVCPPGEDMVWVPEHNDANNNPVGSKFECRRNILGMAAYSQDQNNNDCVGNRAILPRGREDSGFGCARIQTRTIESIAQTQDSTAGPSVADSQMVTLYDPIEYFQPVGPVQNADQIPVARIPNIPDDPNRDKYVVIPGLDGFDCPSSYIETNWWGYNANNPEASRRSQVIAILPNGQLQCIKSWTMLLPPRNICPTNTRTLWLPRYGTGEYFIGPKNVSGSNNRIRGLNFMCEGYAENHPTYGLFNIGQICNPDIAGPVSYVYAPQTNKISCFVTPTSTPRPDDLVTYPTAPDACNNNGVANLAPNDRITCTQSFISMFDPYLRGLPNYRTDWALNLTSGGSLTWVNPRTVKYVVMSGTATQAGTANPTGDGMETTSCQLAPKVPGGATQTGTLDSNGNCVASSNGTALPVGD